MKTLPKILPAGSDASRVAEAILRSLPDWFGLEEPLVGYAKAAGERPTWFAHVETATGSTPSAFITLTHHFPESAEIHCIAVHREHRGRGLGRALVEFVVEHLRARGVRLLQVKTMGPSKPNAEYAETLKFYRAMGFVPVEEFQTLWRAIPCLQLVKVL